MGDIILDLDNLVTTDVEQEGKRFRLRSEVEGTCGAVFQAAGVALPPTVQQVEPSAPGGKIRLVPRRLCDCATHGSVRRCYCILSKTSLMMRGHRSAQFAWIHPQSDLLAWFTYGLLGE